MLQTIIAFSVMTSVATLLVLGLCRVLAPAAARSLEEENKTERKWPKGKELVKLLAFSFGLWLVIAPLAFLAMQVSSKTLFAIGFFCASFVMLTLGKSSRAKALWFVAGQCVVFVAWLFSQNWLTMSLMTIIMLVPSLVIFGSGKVLPSGTFRTYAFVGIAAMVYDILAVYVTDFMQQMAAGVQANGLPGMIIYPRSLAFDAPPAVSLGGGDIIIPALIVLAAWALGIKYSLPLLGWAGIAGYFVGLVVASVVVVTTRSMQPALVFLCPSVILAVTLAAARYRVLHILWGGRRALKSA